MTEHIEHINQLLDGELEQMLEPSLYAELSMNPDLRTELRNQMALRSAVQNDRMALVPPAQLTNSIFSGLGFAAPLAGAAAGAAGGSLLLSWLTRIGLPVLSAVAATGVTYFATTSDGNTGAVKPTIAVQQSASPIQPSAPVQTQTSERRGLDGSSRYIALSRHARDVERENASLRDALAEAQRGVEQPEQESITTDGNVEYPETPLRNVVVENKFSVNNSASLSTIRQGEIPTMSDYTVFPAFTLQLRGFASLPTIATTVEQQNLWYNNLGVAALYRLNHHHMVGLEVGSETYPMTFEGERNGQIVRYEQYPSAGFAGVIYRYTGSSFGSLPFAPFGQVFAGGSTFGPMGRAAVGFEYSPKGPLTFILGAEGSVMSYNYQNTWYASPKIGLTYGMSFRF